MCQRSGTDPESRTERGNTSAGVTRTRSARMNEAMLEKPVVDKEESGL